jgi:Na+-translocating ferredoxin:NAD+ oxidoreductase RnfG subunit
MNKSIFKYALLLVAICAISGLLLAGVNMITAPIIGSRNQINEKLEQYYPYAYYKQADDGSNEVAENAIQAYYYAFDENKNLAAVIYQTSFLGFKSQIVALISIKVDGTVENAKMIGGKDDYSLSDHDFEIAGESVDSYDYTPKSGATTTSGGVGAGIDAAINHFKSIKDSLGGVSYEG